MTAARAPLPRHVGILVAAGLAAVGWAAACAAGFTSPLSLAWLALTAAPLGVVSAPLGRAALVVPALWTGVLLAAGLGWEAAATATGLFAAGAALGRRRAEHVWGDAGCVLLGAAFLAGLPALGGLAGHAPWSPTLTARALDLSPVVLMVESAGFDWTRHPAVYGPAGGDSLGPDLRRPWSGFLAGPTVLLVGCVLLLVARRRPETQAR